MICQYDQNEKSEEPEYTHDLRYVSERPVGDCERCPRFVRLMLKRLFGDFNVYGNYIDMMRQSPIAQNQYDDVTKSKTRKYEKIMLIFLVSIGILFTFTKFRRPLTSV